MVLDIGHDPTFRQMLHRSVLSKFESRYSPNVKAVLGGKFSKITSGEAHVLANYSYMSTLCILPQGHRELVCTGLKVPLGARASRGTFETTAQGTLEA
eukprot:6175276-Pleurochrysis_carterae.AAC.1